LSWCVACGAADPPVAPCPAGEPAVELGAGEVTFSPLADGQDLRLVRGAQGGCHFALAFRTDGFAGRRTRVDYALSNVTDGVEILESRQFVRLSPAGNRCQLVNFVAFVPDAGEHEDDRVRIVVSIEEDGAKVERSVEVVARWPNPVEGLDRSLWCGSG
jgi:hypothetical protein